MATASVLLEVIERRSRAGLLPMVERQVELHYDGECALFVEDRAKRQFLGEIENRVTYEPRLRRALDGVDWCIDCAIIS